MMQKVCFCMLKSGLLERKRAPFKDTEIKIYIYLLIKVDQNRTYY
mgnify:CR=1 FL=1